MYLNTQVDDQMEQYTGFFDNQWKLLVQALIEIGSDPDNQKLQARIRSLATILQLTAVLTLYYYVSFQPLFYVQCQSEGTR